MSLSDLTPGEKQYLESGGTDSAALMAENPPTPASDTPPVAIEPPAAPAARDPATSAAAAEVSSQPADHPEPGEEEIAAPDGKTKRRMVDTRALKAEREKRQSAEAELARFRDNYTRVDERLKMLSEAVSQPDPAAAEQAAAPIDPEQDIFGAYKQLREELEQIKASTTDMREQTAAERQATALVSTYRQDAAAFRQATPDFNDAYNFLLRTRETQLKALNYSEDEVRAFLYNEEMNLASRALGMRQSPSQQLYALAQSMGYRKATPEPPPAPAALGAAPPAPATPPAPSVIAEIATIKAGQNTSRSLSSGGGAAGEELSLATLADMPQKEFEKFMAIEGNREKVEAAMGRRAA